MNPFLIISRSLKQTVLFSKTFFSRSQGLFIKNSVGKLNVIIWKPCLDMLKEFSSRYAPISLLWDKVLLKSDQSSIISFLDRRVYCGSHDIQCFVLSESINCYNKVSKEYFRLKRDDFAVEKLNFYQKIDFLGKFV